MVKLNEAAKGNFESVRQMRLEDAFDDYLSDLPIEVVARKNCTVSVLDVMSECLVIQRFLKSFLVVGVFNYCFGAMEISEVPVQRCRCWKNCPLIVSRWRTSPFPMFNSHQWLETNFMSCRANMGMMQKRKHVHHSI
jgi:hypothetical protein